MGHMVQHLSSLGPQEAEICVGGGGGQLKSTHRILRTTKLMTKNIPSWNVPKFHLKSYHTIILSNLFYLSTNFCIQVNVKFSFQFVLEFKPLESTG